jgi:hypothetical protein
MADSASDGASDSAGPPLARRGTGRPSTRRRVLERLWIVGSVAYGGLRVFIADRTVKRYGVNIWAFASVELVTSFIYGLSSARVGGALIDRRADRAVRWGVLTAASFLAPETFILLTGRRMPMVVYIVIGALLATLGTVAAVSLRRKVRAGRRRRREPGSVSVNLS